MILLFCRNAIRVAANQDGDNIVPQRLSGREVREINRADKVQQTESRDHK